MNQASPYDIVIIIPVADRPRHLAGCLHSLQEMLRRYPYAGEVSVLVAEDSKDEQSVTQHHALAEAITSEGLVVYHLAQDEQRRLVEALPAQQREALIGVIGDGTSYAHKGASSTRNIAYLWLRRLQQDGRKRLFWFIDSDQEFRVNIEVGGVEEERYAIDYCYALDRIFRETPTRILTGKVVGDPPVSPAVMAGNFLDDVAAFLVEMSRANPMEGCTFHSNIRHADDAAYHDMAELFGFGLADLFRYHCPLHGSHDHMHCFADFAAKLGRFFDGEHPTRRSVYEPAELMATIKPARTIYTGNYVFTSEGLDYFIPFAGLKLRMAGPTLGRIIKAEIGETFVSVNLPMLHRRTIDVIGQSEFRAGIERALQCVDLSGEFERQYFGDVMLFSMERLSEAGFPYTNLGKDKIEEIVSQVESEMHGRYTANHHQYTTKIKRLQKLFEDPDQWWHRGELLSNACAQFGHFIANMQNNFGDNARGWQLITDEGHRDERIADIVAAIGGYCEIRSIWKIVIRGEAA